jgi:GGDEF domain-containing protein
VEADEPEAVRLARRLVESLATPFQLLGRPVVVTASIGVAVGSGRDLDQVLREADLAMYAAKSAGKARFKLATTGDLNASLG